MISIYLYVGPCPDFQSLKMTIPARYVEKRSLHPDCKYVKDEGDFFSFFLECINVKKEHKIVILTH